MPKKNSNGFFGNNPMSILFILVLLFSVFAHNPIAYSDFPRKEIMDDVSDVQKIDLRYGNKTRLNLTYNDGINNNTNSSSSSNVLDIQRVSLYQKSSALNATVWLGGNPLLIPYLKNVTKIAFGVLIDSDKNTATGKEGVDYQLEFQMNRQIWYKLLYEYSSLGQYRILESTQNYTNFIESAKKNPDYLLFSLDMNKLFVQDSFKVMFYSLATYNDGKIEIDLTNWINIPNDTFNVFTTPDVITLKQGESKVIGLQLVSSSGEKPTIKSLYDFQNYTSINIELLEPNKKNANETNLNINETEPIQLKVTVPKNAKVGKHVIPISSNFSLGSIFPSKFIDVENKIPIHIDAMGFDLKSGNFTINVVEPPSFQEELRVFWAAYGSIISLIGAGFAGGLSSLFFESVKEKKKQKREFRDKNSS
jgi:hypothetical protein